MLNSRIPKMKLDFMYWAVFSAYAELAHSHTLAGHLYSTYTAKFPLRKFLNEDQVTIWKWNSKSSQKGA